MDQVDEGRPADAGVTFKDWPAAMGGGRWDEHFNRSIGQRIGHAARKAQAELAELVAAHQKASDERFSEMLQPRNGFVDLVTGNRLLSSVDLWAPILMVFDLMTSNPDG